MAAACKGKQSKETRINTNEYYIVRRGCVGSGLCVHVCVRVRMHAHVYVCVCVCTVYAVFHRCH